MRAETKLELIHRGRLLSSKLPGPWNRRARELAKAALNYRGGRASGRRALSFARLARSSRWLVTPFGQGHLVVDTHDDEIGRAVFMTGGYERVYMQTAVDYLSGIGRSTRGTTFIDIGANIGTSTVDALLHFGFARAVSFEPDADNLRLLGVNLALNNLSDRVVIHGVALSDTDGLASMRRSLGNSGDHRLVTEAPGAGPERPIRAGGPGPERPIRAGGPGPERPIRAGGPGPERPEGGDPTLTEVPCARLDTLVVAGSLDPAEVGLVWIDTQGHEAFTLAGAQSLIDQGTPIVVEYCPEALEQSGSLSALEELIARSYDTMVDLHLLSHGSAEATLAAGDTAALRGRYHGYNHTDLLLLRNR